MATPKLNKLAQRFMQQIQDPITIDAGVILPGTIIRSVAEIEHYLGMAMMQFIAGVQQQAQGSISLLLRALPDLYEEREVVFPSILSTADSKIDISSTHADLYDLCTSRGTGYIFEPWDPKHLSDVLNGLDPFREGSGRYGGLIYQKPYLWLFPKSIHVGSAYTVNLCFIKAPLNPLTGEYLISGGDYDIPFADVLFPQICNIATKLYKVDDYQEDAQ